MRARRGYVLLPAVGLLIGTASTCAAQGSGARTRSESEDKADFEMVCGACHTPGMVSDIRGLAEWKDTVDYMVSLGAGGSREQMEAVMRVLMRTHTRVNVNTAPAEQLPLVLDISDDTARALVEYRATHGNFKTLDDLKKVPGIDAAKLHARKDRVVF